MTVDEIEALRDTPEGVVLQRRKATVLSIYRPDSDGGNTIIAVRYAGSSMTTLCDPADLTMA